MKAFLARLLSRVATGGDSIPNSLSGTFDIRGGCLEGVVQKIPELPAEGMVVAIARHGRILTSAPAGPAGVDQRLAFTLPLRDHATLDEFIRESVQVTARNARGDTGTLTLDGATQLELAREHFGAPAETILDLDFSRAGNARPFLGEGWSGAEELFTWTEGANSFIRFASPGADGDYRLRLRYGAFIRALVPVQALEVFVNEEHVGYMTTDTHGPQFRELRIAPEPFGLVNESVMRLYHPNAGQSHLHGDSTDTRHLAFSFRRLTLVRLLPD